MSYADAGNMRFRATLLRSRQALPREPLNPTHPAHAAASRADKSPALLETTEHAEIFCVHFCARS